MGTNTSKGVDPKALLFRNFITEYEWAKGKIKDEKEGEKDIEKLTKEFRVKYSHLCEEMLSFLRGEHLASYRGKDIAT